jgi:hypothetical protein
MSMSLDGFIAGLHALWLGPADAYSRHWLAGNHGRLPTGVARELAEAAWICLKAGERR